MRRFSELILLLWLFTSASGLCGTKLESFHNPQFPVVPYHNVLVSFNADLPTKKSAEQKTVKSLSKKSQTHFYADSDLFSPLSHYSESERLQILQAQQIDAILSFEIVETDSYLRSEIVPTWDFGFGFGWGYSDFGFFGGSVITYTVWVWSSEIQLADLNQNAVVWMAQAHSESNNRQSMLKSIIKKSVQELLKSGWLLGKKSS